MLRIMGIMASPNEYTDVWTRDAFFSIMGLSKHLPNHPSISKPFTPWRYTTVGRTHPVVHWKRLCVFQTGLSYQRWTPKPHYGDAKTGNMVTDSCFQFIILKRSRSSMQKSMELYANIRKRRFDLRRGSGILMDTVSQRSCIYTNILYYQAAKMMNKTLKRSNPFVRGTVDR